MKKSENLEAVHLLIDLQNHAQDVVDELGRLITSLLIEKKARKKKNAPKV